MTQLLGKEVYVLPGSIRNGWRTWIRTRRGIEIRELVTDTLTVENLISWVADGKIDYTVASNDVARINRTYYANLDIDLVLSFDQRSSWAVRKTSPLLAEAADRWHRENINSPEFKASAKRYFELNKRPAHASILR